MKKLLILVLFIAPLSLCAQKFGHFNSADIIQAMPEYKTSQEELQKLQKQYETFEKKARDEHPNLKPIERTYAGIYKIANYAMRDFTPWLKENLPKMIKDLS